jgi:hypothetical protein
MIFLCSEKVTIQNDKTCIYLEGAGKEVTSIEWNDHESTSTSATFTAQADNLVVKGIAFKVRITITIIFLFWNSLENVMT